MARVSDVRTSEAPRSRDSSPDPLEAPTSPVISRSARNTPAIQRSPSPARRRKVGRPRKQGTPSRTLILDTPKGGDASPWRIKVTVEAEPQDGSPGKRFAKTTTLPLNDSLSKRESSPMKRKSPRKDTPPAEPKRRGRPPKRKGTPIRDARPPRPQPAPETDVAKDIIAKAVSHTPGRGVSGRLSELEEPGSDRSKRLSYAREELDQALQDAVRMSDALQDATRMSDAAPRCDAPGDKTVSMNEDFSMISFDSLQATKEHGLSHSLRTIPEADNSAVTISYMNSSPPKASYPDLSRKAEKARISIEKSATLQHDPMNWQPTQPMSRSSPQIRPSSMLNNSRGKATNKEVLRQRYELMSTKLEKVPVRRGSVVDEEMGNEANNDNDGGDQERNQVVQQEEATADEDAAEDLWQIEASREIENGQHDSRRPRPGQIEASGEQVPEPQLQDLFAGQPEKPPRPKIPRTWRRSSGNDFQYVDSPAHEPAAGDVEQAGVQDERRSSTDCSGVLTPPEIDDEVDEADADEEEEESDFEPDAEATRVYEPHPAATDVQEEADDLDEVMHEADSDDGLSPDGGDTGNVSANNQPQVFKAKQGPKRRGRPPRKKAMDLTELLNLDAADSPVKAAAPQIQPGQSSRPFRHTGSSSSQKKPSSVQQQRVDSGIDSSHSSVKTHSSPLRRSLLRSSKMHGSPPVAEKGVQSALSPGMPTKLGRPRSGFFRTDRQDEEGDTDSLSGKTPDQKQLLREARSRGRTQLQYIQDYAGDDSNSQDVEIKDAPEIDQRPQNSDSHLDGQQDMEDHEYLTEPSKSYEERLNLDSPTKVKVNFNDSRTNSLIAPSIRHFPPLFGSTQASRAISIPEQSTKHEDSPSTITLIDEKRTSTSTQTGLLTRLSTSFWSAVTHSIPPSITPQPQTHEKEEKFPQPESMDTHFRPHLRAQLRQRYGVVPDCFPWTMYHMRTLHRMLNSLSSRSDSLIPRSGRLPQSISELVGTEQVSVTGYSWRFTRAQAYVVWSFFQLRMPMHVIDRMRRGEIQWLGDRWAKRYRGYYDERRHGDDPVFRVETHGRDVAEWVDAHEGVIGIGFVVKMLGTAVRANEKGWDRI